jgi:hypothetical protein
VNQVFASLAVVGVLVGGCQKSRDEATEAVVERIIASKGRESNVEIDREHGSIRVTLGGAIKPQGWPPAVPVYPYAERAKIEKADRNDGDSKRLSVITADSIAELRSFYREALAKDGWAVGDGEGKSSPEASPWTARRGDEDLEIVFVARDHGKGSRADIEYRKRS